MIRSLFRSKFYNSVDVFSTRNLKRFGSQDYPEALRHSRPFSKIYVNIGLSRTSNGITVAS